MSIHRLIYCSQAAEGRGTYQDVADIRASSEVNNQRDQISGLLAFGGMSYLQLIEGERESISRLYSRICKDQRHTNTIMIEFKEADGRAFPVWSMKVVQLDLQDRQINANLFKFSGTAEFIPASMNARQCFAFLKSLLV